MLIQGIWTNIIDNGNIFFNNNILYTWFSVIYYSFDTELRNATSPSSEDKLVILLTKVRQLGQDYFGSPHCFPIGMSCLLLW